MSTPWPSAPPRPGTPRWVLSLIAVVTVLVVAAGVFVALTLLSGSAGASEVIREPVRTAGANPFMPAVGTDAEQVAAPAGTGGTFRGDTPGLYGGTRDNRTCDAAKLTGFLDSHPGQAAAWAGVLGIRTADIDSFVSTLTPVLLRSDTWVTNHGYAEGRATVVSSVLQSGSAVFVDRHGTPVVRCACGNPLTAPTLLASPVYVGPTWVSFNQTNITVVQNTSVVINDYTLVDPWRNRPFTRPGGFRPGPTGDGEYQAPLTGQNGSTSGPTTSGDPSELSSPGGGGLPSPANLRFTCPDGSAVAEDGGTGDARVETTAGGDLNTDGTQEAVALMRCGTDQQVQVVDGRTGAALATLTPQTPPGSPLPAQFDASSFRLDGTTLTTGVKVFGAEDTEATGPSQSQTWTWAWDGTTFTLAPDAMTAVETSETPTPTESVPPTADTTTTTPSTTTTTTTG